MQFLGVTELIDQISQIIMYQAFVWIVSFPWYKLQYTSRFIDFPSWHVYYITDLPGLHCLMFLLLCNRQWCRRKVCVIM